MKFDDLEESFKELQKEFGVEFDEDGHCIRDTYMYLNPKVIKILNMFESILYYLDEKVKQETGYYDDWD